MKQKILPVMLASIALLGCGKASSEPSNTDSASSLAESSFVPLAEQPPIYPYAKNINDYLYKFQAELDDYYNDEVKKNENAHHEVISSTEIHEADMNGDGKSDVVLEIFTCEENSCHQTTHSYSLAVFLNRGTQYKYLAEKRGIAISIDSLTIENDYETNTVQIKVVSNSYGRNDAMCCPSVKETDYYALSNNLLVKVA